MQSLTITAQNHTKIQKRASKCDNVGPLNPTLNYFCMLEWMAAARLFHTSVLLLWQLIRLKSTPTCFIWWPETTEDLFLHVNGERHADGTHVS